MTYFPSYLAVIIVASQLMQSSPQTTCTQLIPYPGMQYLTASQLAQYKLTNPCSVICKPGFYGDFCTPIPSTSPVPQGPWNQVGYYTTGFGVLQTMSLSVANYISQISFTSSDSLLIGLYYPYAVVLISLNTRQQTQILSSASIGYSLDAIQVRYGRVFIARSKSPTGPFDISTLTGQLQVGPYSTQPFMSISARALLIEIFIDKGMSTAFVFSMYPTQGRLLACYPDGSCTPWLTVDGVTGVVCGMDCPRAVFISVGSTILNVTSNSYSTLVSSSTNSLINCIASSPGLNTLLYRTNTYVNQISLGTFKNAIYNAVLTLSNPTVSCSQCCSLDISDSQSLVILVENSVINTVESLQQLCPFESSSLPVYSTSSAACFACPPPPSNAYLVTNSPSCGWRCLGGYAQFGSQCIAAISPPCPAFFYPAPSDQLFGQCLPSVMPWAPGGTYLALVVASTPDYIYTSAPGTVSPPYILAAGLVSGLASELASGILFLAKASALYVSQASTAAFRALNLFAPAMDPTVCNSASNNYYYYLTQQGGYLWVGFVLRATLATTSTNCLWALDTRNLLNTGSLTVPVAQAQYWTLGGQVCSATGTAGTQVFVILCGTNYILQTQMAAAAVFSIYAGQLDSGYLDGSVQTALFSAPTSLVHFNQRLYVTDTNNCVIREIDLLRNTTWTVAGTAGVCERQDGLPNSLRYPTSLSLTPYDGFLLFMDKSPDESAPTIRQYHTVTGYVWTAAVSALPLVTTPLALGSSLILHANSTGLYYRLTASSTPCPPGTVALEGSAMSFSMCQSCGPGTFSNKTVCADCSAVSCTGAGQRPVRCSGSSDSHCGQCTNKPNSTPAIYTGPAQSYDGWTDCPWVYTPPCPIGTYQNQTICTACPAWSTTQAAGATSIASCSCLNGSWDSSNQHTCVIPSPFNASQPSECKPLAICAPFVQPAFPFALLTSCPYAALDSILGVCPCNPGEYIARVYPKLCLPCPSYLYSPDGQRCERCPRYAEPSLDGSACRCSGGTVDVDVSIEGLQCVCGPGQAFSPSAGCVACAANTYTPDGLTLTATPWLQSKACQACPAGTWSSPGQTACTACASGKFRNFFMKACTDCAKGRYATNPTTELSCKPCSAKCNGRLESPCPTDASLLVCSDCPPKRDNADFNGADNCATSCIGNFYERDGACVPCTTFNATTCPMGNQVAACGAFYDASCAPCENATKPLYYSQWVNDTNGGLKPSQSCAWQCIEGYMPAPIAWKDTSFAVWECTKANTWSLFNMFTI